MDNDGGSQAVDEIDLSRIGGINRVRAIPVTKQIFIIGRQQERGVSSLRHR